MDNKQIIEHLKNVLTKVSVTIEEKEAIECAIKKLAAKDTKQTLIEVAKILAGLFNAGMKIFD